MVSRPLSLRPFGVALALAFGAIPTLAAAAPCNFGPPPNSGGIRDFAGADWTINDDSVVLCTGQYINIGTLTIPQGRRLRIGDGAEVLVRADVARILGEIDGAGVGPGGGRGCQNSGGTHGGAGGGQGGGSGGRSTGSGSHGGGGGGGAGHGDEGGAGGRSTSSTPGGNGGNAYGQPAVLTSGSGGGGGACGAGTLGVADTGGSGGHGGAALLLEAADLDLSGSIDLSGGRGSNGNTAGGGGGGGSGGGIILRAHERFTWSGTLAVAGGVGGNGAQAPISGRAGGGGGGGAGGRVELFVPQTCADAWADQANVSGGAPGNGPGNARNGTPGRPGIYRCADVQQPPVLESFTADPNPAREGATVTLTAVATDPNHHLLKYEFDCGNGVFSPPQTSPTFPCVYDDNLPNEAPFTARVRVSDWNRVPFVDGSNKVTHPPGTVSFGGLASGTTSVVVHNAPPQVTLNLPDDPRPGIPLTFSIDVVDPSTIDQQAGFDVTWRIGDPAEVELSAPDRFEVSHEFSNFGTFPVDVRVTDKDGDTAHVHAELVIPVVPPTVTLGPFPPGVTQGKVAAFSATAIGWSPAELEEGYLFEFDFGDGTRISRHGGVRGEPVEVLHVYESSGSFTVTVTARSMTGGTSAPDSRELEVLPGFLPPAVAITANPRPVDEGEETMFAVSFSPRAPGTSVVSVDLHFGDGTNQQIPNPASPRSLPHTYDDSGLYTAHVLVVDSSGAENLAYVEIDVTNVSPTAFIASDVHGLEGQQLHVVGSATDPSIADIHAGLMYTWDFGDGTDPVSGTELKQPFHTWANSGEYTITLIVSDKDGGQSQPVTATAHIDNVPPEVELIMDGETTEGAVVTFSTVVTDPSPADTAAGFTFQWDFGDGSERAEGKGLGTVDHMFEQDGEYRVRLTVTDDSGGSTEVTGTIIVHNVAPTVDLGPPRTVGRHETVVFTANIHDPGRKDTHTYRWDFGDGTTSTEPSPSHSWSQPGEFTVTLVVTDDAGDSGSGTLPISVPNGLPVASQVRILPLSPDPSDDLTLTWTYLDPEGDEEQGTVVDWFVDGVIRPSLRNRARIPAWYTLRSQTWHAEVTPHDGYAAGETVRSNEVTIGNTPPLAANVRLEPGEPTRADGLTLLYDFVDPDDDVEGKSSIRWWRDGDPVPSLDDVLKVEGLLSRGQVWKASIRPHDGDLHGNEVEAAPVTVGNSPPRVTPMLPIAVPSVGSVTPVTWTIEATDHDDDPLEYRCISEGRVLGTRETVSVSLPDGAYAVECTVTDGIDSVAEVFQLVIGDHGPVVHAGPDVEVDPGRVTLRAIGQEPLGRPLSFEWRVLSSVEVIELSSHHSATTDFFARTAGFYELEVSASNGEQTVSDTVRVLVRNLPPTADAGPGPVEAREGEELALSADASTDPNGDDLSYRWQRVSGPPVQFVNSPHSADFQLIPHGSGVLVLRLTVSDGEFSDSADVSVRVAPIGVGATPPVAVAGEDQMVLLGETVELDGSGSFDVDRDALTYEWTQVSGPQITLGDSDRARARFTATQAGMLSFRLRVFDGLYESADQTRVQVIDSGSNRRPMGRVASQLVEARIGDVVELDGSSSSDPDGDSLTFQWKQVRGPWVNLTEEYQPIARLVAVSEGRTVLELRVNDGMIDSHPVFVEVLATESGPAAQPVAIARAPEVAYVGERITLDGTNSHDPEGRELTFSWSLVEGQAELEPPGGPSPVFVPQSNGRYVFRLVVSNGIRASDPADVTVLVENLPELMGGCGCSKADGGGSSLGSLLLGGLMLGLFRRRNSMSGNLIGTEGKK